MNQTNVCTVNSWGLCSSTDTQKVYIVYLPPFLFFDKIRFGVNDRIGTITLNYVFPSQKVEEVTYVVTLGRVSKVELCRPYVSDLFSPFLPNVQKDKKPLRSPLSLVRVLISFLFPYPFFNFVINMVFRLL